MNHFSRQDRVMIQLNPVFSGVTNNTNETVLIPPSILPNRTAQRIENNTPRNEVGFNEAARTRSGSGNNNLNDPSKPGS